jgi:predicted DNA-binding ribbon-helix-helix protein
VALLDNEYGWFQVLGKGSLRTLASAAIGTRLNTTATAGAVDDDGHDDAPLNSSIRFAVVSMMKSKPINQHVTLHIAQYHC